MEYTYIQSHQMIYYPIILIIIEMVLHLTWKYLIMNVTRKKKKKKAFIDSNLWISIVDSADPNGNYSKTIKQLKERFKEAYFSLNDMKFSNASNDNNNTSNDNNDKKKINN